MTYTNHCKYFSNLCCLHNLAKLRADADSSDGVHLRERCEVHHPVRAGEAHDDVGDAGDDQATDHDDIVSNTEYGREDWEDDDETDQPRHSLRCQIVPPVLRTPSKLDSSHQIVEVSSVQAEHQTEERQEKNDQLGSSTFFSSSKCCSEALLDTRNIL